MHSEKIVPINSFNLKNHEKIADQINEIKDFKELIWFVVNMTTRKQWQEILKSKSEDINNKIIELLKKDISTENILALYKLISALNIKLIESTIEIVNQYISDTLDQASTDKIDMLELDTIAHLEKYLSNDNKNKLDSIITRYIQSESVKDILNYPELINRLFSEPSTTLQKDSINIIKNSIEKEFLNRENIILMELENKDHSHLSVIYDEIIKLHLLCTSKAGTRFYNKLIEILEVIWEKRELFSKQINQSIDWIILKRESKFWWNDQLNNNENIFKDILEDKIKSLNLWTNIILEIKDNHQIINVWWQLFWLRKSNQVRQIYDLNKIDRFLTFTNDLNLLETIDNLWPEWLKNAMEEQYNKQTINKNKVEAFSLSKEKITHIIIAPKRKEESTPEMLISQAFINSSLDKNHNIESHQFIFTDNPLHDIVNSIHNSINKNIKNILIDINSHGMLDYYVFKNKLETKDLIKSLSEICEKDQEIKITINSVACFSWWILSARKDSKETWKNNLNIIAQSKENMEQSLWRIINQKSASNQYLPPTFTPYSSLFYIFFEQALFEWKTYGEALEYADHKIFFKLHQNNAQYIFNGEDLSYLNRKPRTTNEFNKYINLPQIT